MLCVSNLQRDGGAHGALVLSTCNRTEIYAHAPDGHLVNSDYLTERLRAVVGPGRFPERDVFYRYGGHASAQHMFRVAAGLDSMILGEKQQIFGAALKSAYTTSSGRAPVAGHGVRQGRAVRVQSWRPAPAARLDIGRGAVSTASAGHVHLATRIYGGHVTLLQSWLSAPAKTGRFCWRNTSRPSTHSAWIVLNRTLERAEAIARRGSLLAKRRRLAVAR